MGPNEFLTDAEELVIVNYIISAQGRTLPVTKDTIMSLVSSLLSDKQSFLEINHDRRFKCRNWRPSEPEEQWYQLFLKRHPTIDVRMKEYFSSSRRNVNQQDVKQWFAYIYSYLAENDLLEILHEAKRNFNINEAIFEFSPKELNLLAEKGSKIDNELDRLTVLVNIGANGSLLPPLIICPKKAAIGKIDSGQINNDILYKYLCNDFDEWLTYNNIQRPVIVWVDKHESRMQYNLVKILTELQIILILIPPNTSHFMQPLDVGMLTPMKEAWAKCVNNFCDSNPNECITKENFARIFLPMYASVISQDQIKAAFRKCGIHPFDVKAPDYSKPTLIATHSSYTTIFREIEQNGMIERRTQITMVPKLYASSQTWFPQSSEISKLNMVAMTAFGAPREIFSKGCDGTVCYIPRNDLTNESKPTSSSLMKTKNQPMQEPGDLNCEGNPSSYSIKTQDNLTIGNNQEEEIGLGEEGLLNPPFEMEVDDLRDQGKEIIYKELLDPLPELNVDAELLGPSLKDNYVKRAKLDIDPPPYLEWEDSLLVKEEWEDSLLVKEEWEDEKYSYPPLSSEPNLETVQVSDSTMKDEFSKTSKEELYPFLKECFVSVERLPKKFIVNKVPKYVDTEKVSDSSTKDEFSKTSKEKLNPFLKECFVSVERLSKKFTVNKVPKYVDTEKGFHFPEEIKEQMKILSRSTKNGSDIQCLINDTSNISKRIRLTLEPTDNLDVESESKAAYSISEKNIDSVDKPKSPYCNKCDRKFRTKNGLNRHILVIHEKIEPIKCCSCDFIVSEKETLSEHIISAHINSNQYKCPNCELTFDLKGTLSIHLKIDHNVLPFKCTYCDFAAGYNKCLISHVKSVHGKLKPFKCLECNRLYGQKGDLFRHVNSIHKKIKPFKCLECNYTCCRKNYFESHVKSVHEKIKPFKCLECNRSFSQKSNLASHMTSVHNKIKPFKCLECNYLSSQKFNLINHVKSVHKKIKPFKCFECNHSCSRKCDLLIHIKSVHEKLKPSNCLKCNRSFSRKGNLAIHMTSVHNKIKPYKCLKCNYSFSRKYHLESHVNSIHEKIKPFKCLECNRSFSIKSNLAVHMTAVHNKIKPFKCLKCNYLFGIKGSLTYHMKSVHEKNKRFNCLECNRSFNRKSNLTVHNASVHKSI